MKAKVKTITVTIDFPDNHSRHVAERPKHSNRTANQIAKRQDRDANDTPVGKGNTWTSSTA
nr:hypothetical protein [Candidatus Njordarchaeum guaymaensis]